MEVVRTFLDKRSPHRDTELCLTQGPATRCLPRYAVRALLQRPDSFDTIWWCAQLPLTKSYCEPLSFTKSSHLSYLTSL